MQLAGPINMMKTSLVGGEAKYSLSIGNETVDMNALVGRHVDFALSKKFHAQIVAIKPTKVFLKDTAFHVRALLPDATCAS